MKVSKTAVATTREVEVTKTIKVKETQTTVEESLHLTLSKSEAMIVASVLTALRST